MSITGNEMSGKGLILFDLDGVLLDSRENMKTAWTSVQREMNMQMPFERYFAEIGRPFSDIMDRLGLSAQADRIESIFKLSSRDALATTPFFEGVEELLLELKGLGKKLGVVTSKDGERTKIVLDRLPVTFDFIHTPGTDGCRGKPAPDPLLMASAVANEDPSDTVYIGDMDPDSEAACRAGIDYIHAAWGYGGRPAEFSALCDDIKGLAGLLLPQKVGDPSL